MKNIKIGSKFYDADNDGFTYEFFCKLKGYRYESFDKIEEFEALTGRKVNMKVEENYIKMKADHLAKKQENIRKKAEKLEKKAEKK